MFIFIILSSYNQVLRQIVNLYLFLNQPSAGAASLYCKAADRVHLSLLPAPHEQQLLAGCLAHNRAAQHQLYQRYKTAMFSCALRILNDRALAQDALQDAFVAVFQQLAAFRQHSTLGAWIKRIVVQMALQTLRREQRMEVYDHERHPEPLVPWHDGLTGEALAQAIAELPAGYRAVFCLVEVEGYLHREVAELLSISEGTSKSQLHQAKRLLQTKLASLYHD